MDGYATNYVCIDCIYRNDDRNRNRRDISNVRVGYKYTGDNRFARGDNMAGTKIAGRQSGPTQFRFDKQRPDNRHIYSFLLLDTFHLLFCARNIIAHILDGNTFHTFVDCKHRNSIPVLPVPVWNIYRQPVCKIQTNPHNGCWNVENTGNRTVWILYAVDTRIPDGRKRTHQNRI